MQEHRGDEHQGLFKPTEGKQRYPEKHTVRAEVTAALTPRETLSHDHISALLWLKSEMGKELEGVWKKVTRGQRGATLFV